MPGPLYRNLHTSDGNIVNVAFLDLLPQQVLSTARPLTPPIGSWIYETDTFATMQYQSATTGWTPIWNLPWGVVGYASVTADQGSITTVTDLTSLTVTFTAVANRRYRIKVIAGLTNTTASAESTVFLTDGSNTTKTQSVYIHSAGGPTTRPGAPLVELYETYSAGSITRKARCSAASGTTTLKATTTPAFIVVEDIGPSANPA